MSALPPLLAHKQNRLVSVRQKSTTFQSHLVNVYYTNRY